MNSDNNNYKITANASTKTDGIPNSSAEEPTKPKKPANARKEFKDVLSEEDQESGMLLSKEELEAPRASAMSLFASAGRTPKKDMGETFDAKVEVNINEMPKAKPMPQTNEPHILVKQEVKADVYESPSALFGKMSSGSEKDVKSLSKKEKINSEYGLSQSDISFIPTHGPVTATNEINLMAGAKVEQTAPVASPIHDIVVELIDKLTIIQQKGQTDTVVTLNMPGVFKGTIVVISEFDTAHGQLNLSFQNLTAQAKTLIDSLPNREALLVALSERGYTVQTVVATTLIENRTILSGQADFGKQQRNQGEPGSEQQQKQPQR